MTHAAATTQHTECVAGWIADEYLALADLLEVAGPLVWDEQSLCEGWRTREVVAHMTMPVRYEGAAFLAELEAAGGDFSRLSNTVAARDAALPTDRLLAGLRSEALHGWQPPGGGVDGALVHCVVHCLDIVEAIPLPHHVPEDRLVAVLSLVADSSVPNLFGIDLSDVELRADDLVWSSGVGTTVEGPAQALALVACGRHLPPGRLHGAAAPRFTQH